MIEDLLKKMEKYSSEERGMVEKAYALAKGAHEGQKRHSGEDYIIHPLEVAKILADLNLDCGTIVAGILHDVIEDTPYDYQDISNLFSPEIAMLVDGVTKLGKLAYKTKEEQQAESLRKMFIAMAKDIRVVLIKLADRLHNMRTLKYMTPEKQKSISAETVDIYAPIAHRLGISKIKWEIEDLALRYLEPKRYYELMERVSKKRQEREEYISDVLTELKTKLHEMGIEGQIEGRPKNFYSIYRKMYVQNKPFEQIFDLIAVRVIVDSIKDCYGVLGMVHTLWKPIPGRFKDYIAMPKPNMYQSLHTTVFGPDGQPFEVQIRTWDMHRTSEFGIAAHWKYKEGSTTSNQDSMEEKLIWLRQMLEWQNDVKDTKEFMESLKGDLFVEEVFVFTPQGDVLDLPLGSTPIDFAYKIHSAVGNKCIGAKVNSKMVPIEYKLQNSDIVEIITSTNSNGPSRDWLKIAKSTQAQNKIRQWFKKEKREENVQKGKESLEREARRQGFDIYQIMRPEFVEGINKKLGFVGIEDLYASIGYGGFTANQVISRLKEEIRKNMKPEDKNNELLEKLEKQIQKATNKEKEKKIKDTNGIIVKGTDNIMVKIASCCNPVPGDEIVGYITKGRGVSVHSRQCTNINELMTDADRIIEVEWSQKVKVAYNANLEIICNDRPGLLAEITRAAFENDINIVSVQSKSTKDKKYMINFVITINDIEQLGKVIRKFKKVDDVIDVYRSKS